MHDFSQRRPDIHPTSFVAEGARLIGHVVLEEETGVWYNAVLRADLADIVIGPGSNVQDNCSVHVEDDGPTILGRDVTVGHSAVLHACRIDDNCIIGMGAIILDGASIAPNSIVGAGSLVPPGKTFPEGSLIIGSPARVARKLTETEIARISEGARRYRIFAQAAKHGSVVSYRRPDIEK